MVEIASGIGTPISIDEATKNKVYGHFARILVDIDLTKSFPNNIMVERTDYAFFVTIFYEKMPSFCNLCQVIGHSLDQCKKKNGNVQKNLNPRSIYVPKQAITLGEKSADDQPKGRDNNRQNTTVDSPVPKILNEVFGDDSEVKGSRDDDHEVNPEIGKVQSQDHDSNDQHSSNYDISGFAHSEVPGADNNFEAGGLNAFTDKLLGEDNIGSVETLLRRNNKFVLQQVNPEVPATGMDSLFDNVDSDDDDESLHPESPLVAPNSTSRSVFYVSPSMDSNLNSVNNETPLNPVVHKDIRITSKFWANRVEDEETKEPHNNCDNKEGDQEFTVVHTKSQKKKLREKKSKLLKLVHMKLNQGLDPKISLNEAVILECKRYSQFRF